MLKDKNSGVGSNVASSRRQSFVSVSPGVLTKSAEVSARGSIVELEKRPNDSVSNIEN